MELSKDPDAPSRNNSFLREIRHWMVVNIEGSDLSTGEIAAEYIGSGPPQGTGLHRYVFLLFKQTTGRISYTDGRISKRSLNGRLFTSTRTLITKFSLELVAGNFYQAQYDDYVPILGAQFTEWFNHVAKISLEVWWNFFSKCLKFYIFFSFIFSSDLKKTLKTFKIIFKKKNINISYIDFCWCILKEKEYLKFQLK